jgi:hypothetical protein
LAKLIRRPRHTEAVPSFQTTRIQDTILVPPVEAVVFKSRETAPPVGGKGHGAFGAGRACCGTHTKFLL